MVNLCDIFRNIVPSAGEHLWKISLQTNKYAKSYRVGIYIRQSASGVFNWVTHICILPQPVHLNVWPLYASISTEGVNKRKPNEMRMMK